MRDEDSYTAGINEGTIKEISPSSSFVKIFWREDYSGWYKIDEYSILEVLPAIKTREQKIAALKSRPSLSK